MPTSRKRYMITETDEVGVALERVRQADPDHAFNLAELVVLGAERKIEMLERSPHDDEHRAELRERFLRRGRTGAGVDWDLLLAAHDGR